MNTAAISALRAKLVSLQTSDLRYLLIELAGAGRLALGVPADGGMAVFVGSDISGSEHGNFVRLEVAPFEVFRGEKSWQEAYDDRLERKIRPS
jgi:hypothetical protein